VAYDEASVDRDRLVEAIEQQGYEVIRSPFSFGFAWVHALRIDGDRVTGGADPGTDGMALAV